MKTIIIYKQGLEKDFYNEILNAIIGKKCKVKIKSKKAIIKLHKNESY